MFLLSFLSEGLYFLALVINLSADFLDPAELFAVLYLPQVVHADTEELDYFGGGDEVLLYHAG